jgi:hypothetical protein
MEGRFTLGGEELRKLKQEYFFGILSIIILILLIPPLQPASFTIENRNWDGISKFKTLIEENEGVSVRETTIPLRLLGGIKPNIIIIVGGNLPYFTEESTFLRDFVEKGGNVILFEDHGYARLLTSAFGLTMGGTIINQDNHDKNPYLPIIDQLGIGFLENNTTPYKLIFNKAVRVDISSFIENTTFRPLFTTEGLAWEDQNHDGKFYRTNESIEECFLGGILSFSQGGNFIVIGDSAFPTNDIIDKKDNKKWLSSLFSYLLRDGEKTVLFDESRKLWIPPTGKAALGTSCVLFMAIFHSPIVAIISMIIIGGIIGMRRTKQINKLAGNFRKSLQPQVDIKPLPIFLQSEEENELARLTKRSVIPDLYRAMLADEIRQTSSNMSADEKIKYENYLRYRYIDVKMSRNLTKELKKHILEE